MKLSLIQLTVGPTYEENFKKSQKLIIQSLKSEPDFILFPEHFLFLSNKNKFSFEMNHPAIIFFQEFAIKYKVNILLGSLPIKENNKIFNRSFVIDLNGKLISQYDKIHMFDVTLKNNESYNESDTFTAGNKLKTFIVDDCLMGHSICYDLRFPKLYRALAKKGAKIIVIPSAFTHTTGKAHWHTLVRSRAIENGVYIVAPNQWGTNIERRSTYGHSMVVSPWGDIIVEAKDEETVLNCEIDISDVETYQQSIPVLKNDIDLI
jgi:predicted amidohydrolase